MPCSQNLKFNILFLLRGVRISHFSIINWKKTWNIALAQIVGPLAGTLQLWWVQLIRRDFLKMQTCRRSHCWQRHKRPKCEIKPPSTRAQRSNFKGPEVGKFVWFWHCWRFLGAERLPTLRNGKGLDQLELVSELFVGTNWTIWV